MQDYRLHNEEDGMEDSGLLQSDILSREDYCIIQSHILSIEENQIIPEKCVIKAVLQLHHHRLHCHDCHHHPHDQHTTPLNSLCSQCTNSRRPRRWRSRTGFPHNCNTMSDMLVVVGISLTHMRNWMKYFWFLSPTQLLIHGQWWSIRLETKD